MKPYRSVLVLSAVLLSACSTTPQPVPAASGPAIVVVRDHGVLGSACTYQVRVDDAPIGEIRAGESVARAVRPGRYRVEVANVSALCPNVRLTRVVEVGDAPVAFRLGMTTNLQTIFDQVQ